jgi:dynein heavy chain
VSELCLRLYLDEYEETPWDAIKYLISEANYGGRVTDELDRRVLNSCLNQFYCEDALQVPNYPLSPLPNYYIPDNGPLQSYKDYIATLPVSDRPEAFGQHPNADISYMITDSNIMLDSILLLQPTLAAAAGGITPEAIVDNICSDLMAQVPKVILVTQELKVQLVSKVQLATLVHRDYQELVRIQQSQAHKEFKVQLVV